MGIMIDTREETVIIATQSCVFYRYYYQTYFYAILLSLSMLQYVYDIDKC